MDSKTIIAIFIILVAGGAGLYLATSQSSFSVLGGTNQLSLDKVDLTSSYGPLNGEKWVYTFSIGGLAQYLEGERYTSTVSPDEAKSKNSGGEEPSESLKFDVVMDAQQCVYPIYPTNEEDIYTFNIADERYNYMGKSRCEEADLCGSQIKFGSMFDGFITGVGTCYQVCGVRVSGKSGRFDSPDINSDYTVMMSVDGQTVKKSFSTLNGGVNGEVGNYAYVQWAGSLSGDKSCPDKDQYKPMYINGVWKTIDQTRYDRYLNKFDSLTSSDLITIEVLRDNIAETNNFAEAAVRGVSFSDSVINSQSTTTAKAVVELDEALSFPVITAYIDADWLGVVTPIGKPSIVWANSPTFGSGSGGLVNALVKNLGDGRENFRAYLECPTGWQGASTTFYLDGGESQEISVELSAQTDDEKSAKCDLVVAGTQYTDRAEVDVSVVNYKTCNPGSLYCFGDDVAKCDETGTKYLTVDECDDGCETVDGKPVCIMKEQDDDDGEGDVNVALLVISAILALIAGGAVYGYTPFMTGSKFLTVTRVVISIAAVVAVFLIVPMIVGAVLGLFRISLF